MQILLGSKSPRRQELLKGAGIEFTLVNIDSDENYPDSMEPSDVSEFLAIKKSKAYKNDLSESLLITADTIVVIDGKILNKPVDEAEAIKMLRLLSGKMHEVFTGVCLRTNKETISFTDKTNVYFKDLSDTEVNYYVKNFKPFDKAGAYGVQDWIGYIGVRRTEGDYFNVMGLPVNRVYDALKSLNLIAE